MILACPPSRATTAPKIKAVAFDGLTAFDPRPVAILAEALFPGQGIALSDAWRTRQFEYTWLRTMTGTYVDFWDVTEDALVFAAALLKLDLAKEKRARLMRAFLELQTWPDVSEALSRLRAAGIRMVFLSNFTEGMLDAAVRRCGLQGMFEAHLSTDRVRAYKPDPQAYRMAMDTLGLNQEEVAFAAFAGWDAAGAKAFGYPTFRVNRLNLPAEELSSTADAIGANLHDLVRFVSNRSVRA